MRLMQLTGLVAFAVVLGWVLVRWLSASREAAAGGRFRCSADVIKISPGTNRRHPRSGGLLTRLDVDASNLKIDFLMRLGGASGWAFSTGRSETTAIHLAPVAKQCARRNPITGLRSEVLGRVVTDIGPLEMAFLISESDARRLERMATSMGWPVHSCRRPQRALFTAPAEDLEWWTSSAGGTSS